MRIYEEDYIGIQMPSLPTDLGGPVTESVSTEIRQTCATWRWCVTMKSRLSKEGVGYIRCWPVPPGTERLRKGRAYIFNFLRETVARVRHASATGTVRADSGFYAHTIVGQQDGCTLLLRQQHSIGWTAQPPLPRPFTLPSTVNPTPHPHFWRLKDGFSPTTAIGDTLQLEADHRRHAEVENAIRDLSVL